MDSVPGTGETMVESDCQSDQNSGSSALMAALHQCELIQNMIEISISSLQGLRTKCAASNDLTQQEIHILEVKLVNYISKQLQCKQRVPKRERSTALESYPRLGDWLRTINLKPEIIETVPVKLSLDALLQMSTCQVQDTMKRLGSSSEECSHITAALSCLKRTTERGEELREDGIPWISEPTRQDGGFPSPTDQCSCPSAGQNVAHSPHTMSPGTPTLIMTPCNPPTGHGRSVSVSTVPTFDVHDSQGDLFPFSRKGRIHSNAATPPGTPTSKRKGQLKPHRTPPPSSRKLLAQLLPNITLTRCKSQESQLANRIEEPTSKKKNKLPLNVQINGSGGGADDSSSRSPLLPIHSPYILPGHLEDAVLKNNLAIHRSSPQTMRRDFGLPVTHRFSTKSWLSQVCKVCQKNMMFGVKCKHCKLKCHNKCTKEAPPCHLPFLPFSKIRRAESVPSDINNQIDRTAEIPLFGTLPKAITKKDHPPVLNQQLDSSSNPSSTTSSTPSSPAAFSQGNLHNATPPPNPSPKGRDVRFNFPDVPNASGSESYHNTGESELSEVGHDQQQQHQHQQQGEHDRVGDYYEQEEEEENGNSERKAGKFGSGSDGEPDGEPDGDELDDLPSSRGGSYWRGPISRKASQTSVYLQEWDIPFEQLELGELIGKGRWGKVHRGRWHGEVAVRLLEIDGNNQDHLKLFKNEVMNYRQTRHENVVLFMGACMNPPQLAIITSFCTGRTLYSVVRDSKSTLDINKTRQIAQEIVKGMGYLHAKGIVHKDLKSKNVFYDTNKVVITDFGLFGMSGVVQEGRREDQLKLPHGWICYLAPEIVRRMGAGVNEDRLPFSNAADVYAFGTIWYELQARDWPITMQPAEATIWQVGSGEAIKKVLTEISLGKEVTEILSACWSYCLEVRPTFSQITDMLEKLPKLNRRLSHPGHWKSAESWHHHCLREHCSEGLRSRCPYN
ncbi:kinase suppressor of Ras 1 isoform X2 [Clupea harengus]|uniref:non-specific serine/threonine protein kinase n=1 Tax=Clupea harengus TaxID=7950 RepID=A0A6P8FSV9_CLUHA|nr:kinase suppressor of Ras 1 isoform X2 [Clupea harengus]